ncbi:MAG TPA: hypothetical protein VFJ57_07800 [Solirubrobacterales bacterium]|nr:hypothetical protein [Solirubrobacterales bacterium]
MTAIEGAGGGISGGQGDLPAVGARARLRHEIERFPHFLIEAGATGTVAEASESLIALRMDDFVPGAEEWDNEVCWTLEDGDFFADPDATAEQRIAAAFHDDAEVISRALD